MSDSGESPSRDFSDSSQLTNWILDSGATCHMMPQVSDFIPGSLYNTDKNIGVMNRNHVTAKQKGQVRIRLCDNNGDTFIASLHNVLLETYLCDKWFYIITLMNSWYTCLFCQGFCMVYFGAKEKNVITLPHSAQRKHAFLGKIKEMSETKKLPFRKKFI